MGSASMKRGRGCARSSLVAATAAATLFLAAGASGATSNEAASWKTHVDRAAGFRIDIPAGWQEVPHTVAAVRSRIRQLRVAGRKALADQYAALLNDPYSRKQLREFRFQAFQWPALPSPINTDVYVKITAVPASFREADVPTVANEIAKAFNGPSDHVDPIVRVRLPSGSAVRVRGKAHLDPSYNGAATGFTLYILLRPRRLFLLSFRVDSRYTASERRIFDSIAMRFAFLR
jgi:hypothetical protein